MGTVKRISISGFRGVLAKLDMSFVVGASSESMVIYGRNGTGKSSLTDAWEWLRSQRIEHLAREGAKETAYPHKAARSGESYVEVEFCDDALGIIRADYDLDRVTRPILTGNHAGLAALTPHPCHVRFGDLTRFVFLTKSERYDVLAHLMGFQPQVDFQKGLRRVQKDLQEELNSISGIAARLRLELRGLTGSEDTSDESVLQSIGAIAGVHGLPAPTTVAESKETVDVLRKGIETDPNAIRLSALRQFVEELGRMPKLDSFSSALKKYSLEAIPYRDREDQLKKLLVLSLYERGAEIIDKSEPSGKCPLCGQEFLGDLRGHINAELANLTLVREQHERVVALRIAAKQAIPTALPKNDIWTNALTHCEGSEAAKSVTAVLNTLEKLRVRTVEIGADLDKAVEDLTSETIKALGEAADFLHVLRPELNVAAASAKAEMSKIIESLQGDENRKNLVDDFQRASKILEFWVKSTVAEDKRAGHEKTSVSFAELVGDYIEGSLANVQERFDVISTDVSLYFEMLEKFTDGISKPVLRIMVDQDRAVVPEVVFHGQAVSPAYKYLSESQLNSFGLSVFLASVRHFNKLFRFMILDDVVNSLDGHKRPQLLEILRTYFADYQVLLLTHDSSWRDRLVRANPRWKRLNFVRHEHGIGPIVHEGYGTLEEVTKAISDDRPRQAGQSFGPFLEGELQEIAEMFSVELKYNRRNEYTLEPLLDAVRLRVEKKLGREHDLTVLLSALKLHSGFRNLTAHAKNPDIELTTEEMQVVVDIWIKIDKLVRCHEKNCERVLEYRDPGFRCECGRTVLERA
jgi:hypothetical protein